MTGLSFPAISAPQICRQHLPPKRKSVSAIRQFLSTTILAIWWPSASFAATERVASENNLAWLIEQNRQLLKGCQVRAEDGTTLYTPDGHGNYRALWTRDFTYMVENAGDLLPASDIKGCIDYLIKGIRSDGAVPDRVRPDGIPVYAAGAEDHPLAGPNIDNAQFLVIAVDEYLKKLRREEAWPIFVRWSPALDKAMDWIPRAPSGLVWNDPAQPHSPYGFTDTVGKTGELLFESLLYWTACRRLAGLHEIFDKPALAQEYRRRTNAIEKHLNALWDQKYGAFLAATQDCRQLDIWGNAYAIWLDFPLGHRRKHVLKFLHNNYQDFIWHGQVRHLRKNQHWQRLLTPVAPDRYQNGAYWATASGWMIFALAQTDRELAQNVWNDLIADFRAGGICECINEGYRQLPSYVVSAANPLAANRRLLFLANP